MIGREHFYEHELFHGLVILCVFRMPLVEAWWFKVWLYSGLVLLLCGRDEAARPRFDTSTDMRLVLVPADAEVDSVIFRLRATDQDADFPLVFEVAATITPVVRIDNLPCTLYNKVCQANVILTKRLVPGRLHDFAVRVRNTKGDSNSMQATISATNATTARDKIFPHIPSLIMVPEDAKPGKELDYLLVRANSWSGKPVYIELWQPKELFTIRQRQTPTQTRGAITLIGELDFETQSMYTLTIYATDPYTEPDKDTRNIAGLNIVVVVRDVQDVPPIFTSAPPLTRLNNSVQTGDVILRVHAEDGDKGVPREITYGLVSEGNPFIPFFNISETTGEIVLARPMDELTQITHVGAPIVLTVVAEEIRRSREEPPAQATVVDVGFLLGEPGNSPPYFDNDKYVASIPENLEAGATIAFPEQYSTRVHDEDIGKAGVFALKLQNNNGTFEINPSVAERTADFVITVRDSALIDYETYKSLSFKIIAQEVGPVTNLSASAAVVILVEDVNDNPPVFDEESYRVSLSENITAGTRVVQVHATDRDTGLFGSIRYTGITGQGSDAFAMDPDTGLITVAMGSSLDRETAAQLRLAVNARDENGAGNTGAVPLIVDLLDVNDNAPIFDRDVYEFTLNSDLTNFTAPAFVKATDADAEAPNNEIRYELIHGNYENKFHLNEITGELMLRSPITKFRQKKHSDNVPSEKSTRRPVTRTTPATSDPTNSNSAKNTDGMKPRPVGDTGKYRRKRAESDTLYTLTARAYDLGVPHLASETVIVVRGTAMEARIMMFVVPGEHPNLNKTTETLATITGGQVMVIETRPYVSDKPGDRSVSTEGKRTIVVAKVQQTEIGTPLVDIEKIRKTLAANGVGIIGSAGPTDVSVTYNNDYGNTAKPPIGGVGIHDRTGGATAADSHVNKTIASVREEVTVYKAENKLLFWLLIILAVLMLLAIAALIVCCICPGCPFYMAPRKRRVYSSETLITRSDGRPKRHLHRKPIATIDVVSNGKKQAWSADPTRRNWQFNRRNTKNGGLASLPGDVVYISERPTIDQANAESLGLRDGPAYDLAKRRRLEEQERMYVEDVDERKVRDYDAMDVDSIQRHEIERGSDILRLETYGQRYIDPESNNEPATREQHFYREGNAEVLQLVTRGQAEDTSHHHYPTTLIVDGKDVLLRRFMQDQKARQELSMQETEMARTIESHQRPKNLYQRQQEVLLLPDDLEIRHRHADGSGSNLHKLETNDGFGMQKADAESQMRDIRRQEVTMISVPGISGAEGPSPSAVKTVKEQTRSTAMQSYTFHDLELARQNALLTRLLLERESRHVAGVTMDAASYLETQSLPGQVAIATQTDRAAATQTERHVRSRSDNDESDEDTRNRKKMKPKKRYGENELKRTRALWMKSPIEEEESPCFDKRLSILREKVKEVKEGRKVSLEPEVLREISDSLDENADSCRERQGKSAKTCQQPVEGSNIGYKVLREEKNGSTSSTEMGKQRYEKTSDEKRTESLSSPEISVDNGKYVRETTEEKSSRKESRTKRQKVESVIKPSFRVLEREITMLTKKLSKLADRKVQRTTEHESTSQKKSKIPKASKKDSNRSTLRKTDDSRKRPKQPEACASTSKEPKREKFKYQQRQVISPDSSEYEDAFDKKSKFRFRQELTKLKQPSGQATKAKKQTKMQIGRKEHNKQIEKQQKREPEKRKDAASKESSGLESNAEKTAKSRPRKLGMIGRRENVSEEPGTSTGSDRANGKKDAFADRDSDKKSTESAELPADQRKPKRKLDHVTEEFSDDFVTASRRKDIDQHTAFYLVDTSDTQDVAKYIQVMQQFSDDFTLDGQTEDHRKSIISESEIEQSAIQDSDGEHVTMKEIVEDVAALQDLEYKQTKSKAILDTMEKQQQSDFPEASNMEVLDVEFDDSRNKIIPCDPAVLKTLEEHRTEKLPLHTTVEDGETFHVTENHEKESTGSLEEIEKEILEEDKITTGKAVDELKISTEMLASSDVSQKCTEDSKVSSDAAEDAEREERNGHSDTVASPSETEKDSREQIEQATLLSHPSEAVESREAESDQREESRESSGESKEREKEIPFKEISLAESSTTDIGQGTIEELMQRKTEHDSPCKIKSDVKEDLKITTTGHQDVTEKPKEIPEQHATRTIEETKEDVKSTTEAFEEEASDVKQSLKIDVSSNGILRVLLIDEDDNTLRYIDESSPETSKDNSMQSQPSEITDDTQEDAEKLKSTDDSPKKKVESRESAEEAHTSDLQRTTESEKTDENRSVVHPTETISSKDEEQLLMEHAKTKEELFPAEHEKESEEMSVVKERLGREVKEILDKDFPIDRSSKDSDPAESVVNEPDGEDKSETIVENVDVAEPRDKGEQRADVSVPIFSSFIDTLDVSEESDSSSDISRKTTLTPRPYGTPRHRQKWQQQENLETAGTSGTSKDEGNIESESEEDADSNLSLDEIQNEEDSITIEAAISETKDDTDNTVETYEKVVSVNEKILPVPDVQKVYNRDSDVESRVEKDMESQAGVKSDERKTREVLTTIQDNILAILNVKQLNGDVDDENILSTRENEERKSRIATPRREIEEIPESTEEDGKSKIRLLPGGAEQIHRKRDGTRTKDSKVNKNRTKDSAATDGGRSKDDKKDGTPSTSEKHIAKPESSESYARKKKRPERSRIPSPRREKKRAPDDRPEEKATPSRSRSRIRKSVDGGPRKQPRREDQIQPRPTLPRSKPKADRKPVTSPKHHAEIDVSKTQSKYMAWYKNKREEAEKKKLEKRATEDEEQLPRWVSRASRHAMAESRKREPKERQATDIRTTPEMTPRARRKIKPLVNVESEQLKAIVRQGRRLRRAEGNLNEDPSIEIYAGTPPVPFPDTQHRLLQHSEYKYERIPPPFYLHPPPAPHPSPQLSPERFIEAQPSTSQRSEDESSCLSNVAYQSGGRLRHQQLLEKKSVFDIAYSEAAPSQLRSDSATPPS